MTRWGVAVVAAMAAAGCAAKSGARTAAPAEAAADPHADMHGHHAIDAAAPGPRICGEVRIAPELAAKVPASGAVLFVFAKPQPGGGPPTAVLRDDTFTFPVRFCLSQKNTMAEGMKFEGHQYVTARLDFDGNAGGATGDLETVTKEPVAVGTQDLVLTIDTVRP